MDARWRKRTYPLTHPLRVGDQELRERAVIELQLEDRWAEIAPLPGLHDEQLADLPALLPDALVRLAAATGSFREQLASLNDDPGWCGLPPSVRCALEGALLVDVADFEREVAPMPPTARLIDQDPDASLERVIGARCVKVKVGRRDREAEVALVRKIRRILPADAELRLDANRAFTVDEAVAFAKAVDLTPAYIEEPLADPGGLSDFVATSGWPVALDESLHEPEHAELATHDGVVAWVLKPARLGVHRTLQWFDRAPAGTACVISSSFEGLVGLGLLMELATVAPGHPAPGLGTVDWFAGEGRTTRWTAIR